jgi:CRP-like cAMP-binding protein
MALYRGVGEGFPTRSCESGEVIFNEGDPGEYAFMIMSGQVEILKQVGGVPKVIATLGAGQVVGELAIIGKHPRTAGARALGPTKVRLLSKGDIERELEKLSPWVSTMITGLSTRFVELRDRLLEAEQHPEA